MQPVTDPLLRVAPPLSPELGCDLAGALGTSEAGSRQRPGLGARATSYLTPSLPCLKRLKCTYFSCTTSVHPSKLMLLVEEHPLVPYRAATPASTFHAATLAASQAAGDCTTALASNTTPPARLRQRRTTSATLPTGNDRLSSSER